jgi:c-di-GMP-binding flagellar brake protein YcgR
MGKALDILGSWFGLIEEPAKQGPPPIKKETLVRLKELSRAHTFVEVRFPERDNISYQSLILDVNGPQRYIQIDELFPAVGKAAMPGEPVEIISHGKGQPLHFESEVIALEMADGVPAYRVALPSSLSVNQRRQYFRVDVPEDVDITVRVDLSPQLSPLCKVNNLSSSGINLRINRDVTQYLRASRVIEGIRIHLPDRDVINCDLEVRSYEYRKSPTRQTIVGGRLLSVSTASQKKLDKLLASMQRILQKQYNGE